MIRRPHDFEAGDGPSVSYIGQMCRRTGHQDRTMEREPIASPTGRQSSGGPYDATVLLDARWDNVLRADIASLIDGQSRVLAIATDAWQMFASVGATLADLSRAGADVTDIAIDVRQPSDSTAPVEPPSPEIIRWDLRCEQPGVIEGVVGERLVCLLDDRTLVIAPSEAKRRPIVSAVARAARTAARQRGASLLEYPWWPWFSAVEDEAFWSRARWLVPSLAALRDKETTLNRNFPDHVRECERPDVSAAGSCVVEVALIPRSLDLAARVAAATRIAPARDEVAASFDAMFDDGIEDPWHVDDSPYEQRRLAIVLACLGRPRYRRIIEIGCATGQLTGALAQRADEVIAVDPSPKALAVARRRAGAARIRWVLGAVPQDFPDVEADLVVLSEVGYFLDGPDLLATIRAARGHLAADGELLMANWRRATEHIPLDGHAVQRQTAAMLDLPRRAHYEDVDLIVEVWGQPVSVHDEYNRR
jgi:SAM-dependent methyltransferase